MAADAGTEATPSCVIRVECRIRFYPKLPSRSHIVDDKEHGMNNLIWLVGAVVIVLFVLGYFGFR